MDRNKRISNHDIVAQGLLALCALMVGVVAGLFWSFTVLVMPGLKVIEPLAAMDAMQSINSVVQSAQFGIVFFGSFIISAIIAVVESIRRVNRFWYLTVIAASIHILGVLVVTFTKNVPLNRDLEGMNLSDPANASVMINWIDDWTRWNDIRTISGVAATAMLLVALGFGRERSVTERNHGATT